MVMSTDKWLEFFKYSPAIAALMVVIYLLYRLLVKKDELMEVLVRKTKEDVERQSKIIALLEILVNRGDGK